jgi:hypothetical protein
MTLSKVETRYLKKHLVYLNIELLFHIVTVLMGSHAKVGLKRRSPMELFGKTN